MENKKAILMTIQEYEEAIIRAEARRPVNPDAQENWDKYIQAMKDRVIELKIGLEAIEKKGN